VRKTQAKEMLDQTERERADELLKNFLTVMILTIVIEAGVRIFLSRTHRADEWRWLEWLLVSLIGVCAYLVWTIATWYHRPDAQFQAYTPWYRATAIRGPIIALVILLALTNISFRVELPAVQQGEVPSVAATQEGESETAPPAPQEGESETAPPAIQEGESETAVPATFDFGIDFRRASDEILLVVAFLLGFYSRLAKSLLGRIAHFIFRGVYQETYGKEEQGIEEPELQEEPEPEQAGGEGEQPELQEEPEPGQAGGEGEQTEQEEEPEPGQTGGEGEQTEQTKVQDQQVEEKESQEPEQVMPEEDQEPK
jgi:hypothetical protein